MQLARKNALAALLGAGDKELVPVLQQVVREPALRDVALRGLAAYDHADTPKVILDVYPSLTLAEKRDALNTLASRPVMPGPCSMPSRPGRSR